MVRADALVGVDGVGVLDSEVALFFRVAWVAPEQSTSHQGCNRAFG